MHLQPSEGLILMALLGNRIASTDLLVEVLWPNPDDMPDYWNESLVCQISKLRRKLKFFGGNIGAHYGFGWHLEEPPDRGLAA